MVLLVAVGVLVALLAGPPFVRWAAGGWYATAKWPGDPGDPDGTTRVMWFARRRAADRWCQGMTIDPYARHATGEISFQPGRLIRRRNY